MRIPRLIAAVVSIFVVSAFAAASGQAATYTIGSPLTADFSKAIIGYSGPETFANVILPEPGAHVTSPVEGTVVRWRLRDTTGGPYRLRILAPNPDSTYTGVGTSSPQTLTTTALQSFPTNLPIKAGQTIGLDNTHDLETDKLGAVALASAGLAEWNPALPDGSSRAPKIFTGEEMGEPLGGEVPFNADVVARPGVASVTPPDGTISGGTAVAIGGHDFSGATGVMFGGAAAASFSVVSDTVITAIAPPAALGAIDVTVTTPGGTSAAVAGDKFTYTACIVPKLKGKKLTVGRRKLAAAHCKLGKVRGKGKRVVAQKPKAGSVLEPGAKVGVKLGSSKHRG